MAMVNPAGNTSKYRQHLGNLGPGTPNPASEVRVYKNGKLIRIEDQHGKRIK